MGSSACAAAAPPPHPPLFSGQILLSLAFACKVVAPLIYVIDADRESPSPSPPPPVQPFPPSPCPQLCDHQWTLCLYLFFGDIRQFTCKRASTDPIDLVDTFDDVAAVAECLQLRFAACFWPAQPDQSHQIRLTMVFCA